jgi:hypothetical protein
MPGAMYAGVVNKPYMLGVNILSVVAPIRRMSIITRVIIFILKALGQNYDSQLPE